MIVALLAASAEPFSAPFMRLALAACVVVAIVFVLDGGAVL